MASGQTGMNRGAKAVTGQGARVYLSRISHDLRSGLRDALEWVGASEVVSSGARVFLKPNLTWRHHLPGVTTTPIFIEAVVSLLRDRTRNLVVGESDGGYHSFKAEEAFESHGLYNLRKRFGIQVVNLSNGGSESRSVEIAGRPVTVDLPRFLLEEVDVFITLPVPKVHVMTRVSLGFKNQWGCQPGAMRLRNHPDFARKILAINTLLKPRLALYDGAYFLDKTGPMIGQPVQLDLLIAADDVGAGDLACCEIMGIDPQRIAHLRLAKYEKMMPCSLKEVDLNQSLEAFKTHRFRLRRSVINYIALAAFHSQFGTQLLYDSIAAGPIHRVLYAIRKNRLIGRLLYGQTGPPTAENRLS